MSPADSRNSTGIVPPSPHAALRGRVDFRGAKLAALSGLVAFAAFLSNATHALLDDGPQLVQDFGNPDAPPIWNHVLYFPAARAIAATGWSADQALLLTSCLAGAVMVAAAAMCAYLVTGRRGVAAWAAVVTMTAPLVACHATFVEVHALHGACVALALLVVLASPPSTVAVFCGATLGGVIAGLSHRSAALLAPALAAVAAARMTDARRPALLACFRGSLAVALGLALAYLVDERLHMAWGGPRLFASLEQVEEAASTPWATMLLDESLLALGPLLAVSAVVAAAFAWSSRANISGALLSAAPGAALSVYGGAILAASVPTHGGYWIGAVPFLALGFAVCADRWLGTEPLRAMKARTALFVAVAASVALTLRATTFDATRASLWSQRSQRIEWASSLLPFGGHLLSSSLAKQHVDGASPGVREHEFGAELARRLLAGHSPESIAAELRACIDRLQAKSVGATVAWTCEWRANEAAAAFEPSLLRIEEIAFRGLRLRPAKFGPFDAFVIEGIERQ